MDDGKYPLMDAAAKILKAGWHMATFVDMATFYELELSTLEDLYELVTHFDEQENDHDKPGLERLATRRILLDFIKNGMLYGLPNSPLSKSPTFMSARHFYDFLISQNASAELIEIVGDIFDQLFDTGLKEGCSLAELENYSDSLWPQFPALVDTPANQAWNQARYLIEAAADDPTINANPETVQFLKKMLDLMAGAAGASKLPRLLEPLHREARAKQASDAAQQKNAKARAWIIEQWQSRTDQGQSKRAFADQHRHLVKQKFGVDVTTETITRDWLPRTKKITPT